jgi:1-deoxy-D-xylulose-5-phosphate reductoisomerase
MTAAPTPAPKAENAPMRLSILGATGSIGTTAFQLIAHAPERFALESITAQDNAEKLVELAKQFRPRHVAIGNEAHYEAVKSALSGTGIDVSAGTEAIAEAASRPVDTLLSAIVGAAGLKPTLNGIRQGARIALANKECLVCAGELMLSEIREHGAELLPVDSEHSAIYQVFDFAHPETVDAVILTASGGPFRTRSLDEMRTVTPAQALNHPNWSMGAKITIDSATMMNKGLELIEAYHLFPVREEQIEILVHPQSIIHSLVRYRDGSTLAQLGEPDMATPIAYALSHPVRMDTAMKPLDLAAIGTLQFEAPDAVRFPALRLAREALQKGGGAPIILNAANEIAVEAFLQERIGFLDIAGTVENALQHIDHLPIRSLEDVDAQDTLARIKTRELLA